MMDFDHWLRGTKPYKAKKKIKRLTQEGEDLKHEWETTYGGCYCFSVAPCSSCTHEGHPLNLEESPEYWETVEVDDDDHSG